MAALTDTALSTAGSGRSQRKLQHPDTGLLPESRRSQSDAYISHNLQTSDVENRQNKSDTSLYMYIFYVYLLKHQSLIISYDLMTDISKEKEAMSKLI